jgi:hypothetical protein
MFEPDVALLLPSELLEALTEAARRACVSGSLSAVGGMIQCDAFDRAAASMRPLANRRRRGATKR